MTLERWLNLFALDLLFVLLIVLTLQIAITPIFPIQPYVDVPTSTSATRSPEHVEDLTIHLPLPELIIIGKVAVRLSEVEKQLVSARRDGVNVRIRASRRVPFGDVRRVVQAAQNAGYTRVTILLRAAKPPPLLYVRDGTWHSKAVAAATALQISAR